MGSKQQKEHTIWATTVFFLNTDHQLLLHIGGLPKSNFALGFHIFLFRRSSVTASCSMLAHKLIVVIKMEN